MMEIGEAVLVAVVTGSFSTIGSFWSLKYRLNGTVDTVKRIETKLDETCKTMINHGERIAEIETKCKVIQEAKKDRKYE